MSSTALKQGASGIPGDAVRTTCPYCGVGCGVLATPHEDGRVQIAGDAEHPANFGRLCVKGAALGDTLGEQGRLLYPQLRVGERPGGALERIGWDEALERAALGMRRIIAESGPQAVAMYVSGQLLTEDYYVANKLVKGWWGTANIDTNSRLCMSSAVAGHKRAFGEDVVPGCYEDFEQADLVVLVGSNAAWCHPVLFQRLVRAKEQRPQLHLVVIDPRRTATCEIADTHLPLRPGSDVALFNGLLAWLSRRDAVDRAYVAAHTQGFAAAEATALAAGELADVAAVCGLAPELLEEFFERYARTEKTVTAFSMGVNQSSAGTDKVNAIINCHLATGRIGRPGMGPFSITGQPNAMGGREVGGLANMLAAHMDLDDETHRETVRSFWNSPRIADRPGLKAVDLFRAVEAGEIRAIWIMATNPVVSLPDADQVRRALQRCELVIVSDCIAQTDTTAYAHLLLPATGWAEKDGTVTNSERRISRQRAFLPPSGEARHDWWTLCEVAKRMGYTSGFDFKSAAEIFDEHARLSAYRNEDGRRLFDIGGLAGLSSAQYAALAPLQWPQPAGAAPGAQRLYAQARYSTPDGRARFVSVQARTPQHAPDGDYPLVLNTGRVRDHWHTMTRTGRAARLATHVAEAYVELHPADAEAAGVRDGHLARVRTQWGALVARARLSAQARRGAVFVPIHWNAQFASQARVGALVNPVVDPVSGEPEFKHTPARVEPWAARWHGWLLRRSAAADPAADLTADATAPTAEWWTRITATGCERYVIAGTEPVLDWAAAMPALFGNRLPDGDWLEFEDRGGGVYRAACVRDDRLQACMFIAADPGELPAAEWLISLFAEDRLSLAERAALLAARPAAVATDCGPTVCSCFSVGRNTITQAIRTKGLRTAAEVTACVKAGGNCGSCVPEIRALLAAEQEALKAAPRAA